jgi:hypothetical protein
LAFHGAAHTVQCQPLLGLMSELNAAHLHAHLLIPTQPGTHMPKEVIFWPSTTPFNDAAQRQFPLHFAQPITFRQACQCRNEA